ncbi:hypothetical protein EAI_02358 [Harpegnathos saltator]|uniref:Uncharacterized protein n=1 Tax=Harpegnathos saltator TaxID=610380 RepID=E2BD25_HARSA|nr:hypothetical protein EAI_02358 [Harpegnathos saltator]
MAARYGSLEDKKGRGERTLQPGIGVKEERYEEGIKMINEERKETQMHGVLETGLSVEMTGVSHRPVLLGENKRQGGKEKKKRKEKDVRTGRRM